MASPQRWNHAREGKGELSKSSGISCKFHLLRLIKYTAVGVKLLRICGWLFLVQLFHSQPTVYVFFFSSFLFLRAIVLLIQTEYSSYCSLLSHASRYISQAGKLNLAQGERERERKSYDSRGIRRFFFLFLFFLFFSSSRGLGFNFETKF